jgi:predicted O-methyltransferase YrrM
VTGAGEPPELVGRAQRLADEAGFGHSSSDATGRLLRVLARRCERAGEIGTGCGVGSAWIASGLAPGGSLATVERDDELVRRVRRLFADVPTVRVRAGDWRELLDEPPFDLLFADGGDAEEHADAVLEAVAPGGLVVLDDLAPGRAAADDPLRARWLAHPDLAATEVAVSEREAVVLVARLP